MARVDDTTLMKVGYHHHVPSVFADDGRAYVPWHFGMFTDELARQTDGVVYYTYEGPQTGVERHPLAQNVTCVNLGPRPRAPSALFAPRRVVQKIDLRRDDVDVLLVRGPGPLLPPLLARADVPKAAMIVGDYFAWSPNVANPWWRNALIRCFQFVYARRQARALRDALVLAQNPWLLGHAAGSPFANGRVVFTSSTSVRTIEAVDARRRAAHRDDCANMRLLYTGRIVEEKGVLLIVEALGMLARRGLALDLEIVGWAPATDPTPELVVRRASELGIVDRVFLRDFADDPDALLDSYLSADVFVFASPSEWGSSHTITEAMTACLPVVTSDFEGLRGELTDGEQAVIVPPGSASGLAEGIETLVRDEAFRDRIAANGRRWAEDRTNERSVELVVRSLREWLDRSA